MLVCANLQVVGRPQPSLVSQMFVCSSSFQLQFSIPNECPPNLESFLKCFDDPNFSILSYCPFLCLAWGFFWWQCICSQFFLTKAKFFDYYVYLLLTSFTTWRLSSYWLYWIRTKFFSSVDFINWCFSTKISLGENFFVRWAWLFFALFYEIWYSLGRRSFWSNNRQNRRRLFWYSYWMVSLGENFSQWIS